MASNIMLCFILHVFLRVKSIMLIHRSFRASRKQRILSVKLSISLQIGLRKSATSYQHEFKITLGTKLAKACTLVKLYKFVVFLRSNRTINGFKTLCCVCSIWQTLILKGSHFKRKKSIVSLSLVCF